MNSQLFQLLSTDAKSIKYRDNYVEWETPKAFLRYSQIVNLRRFQTNKHYEFVKLEHLIAGKILGRIKPGLIGVRGVVQKKDLEDIVEQSFKILNTVSIEKKERYWLLGLISCAQRQYRSYLSSATFSSQRFLSQGELELSLIGSTYTDPLKIF